MFAPNSQFRDYITLMRKLYAFAFFLSYLTSPFSTILEKPSRKFKRRDLFNAPNEKEIFNVVVFYGKTHVQKLTTKKGLFEDTGEVRFVDSFFKMEVFNFLIFFTQFLRFANRKNSLHIL
jgi:hypothetical protein